MNKSSFSGSEGILLCSVNVELRQEWKNRESYVGGIEVFGILPVIAIESVNAGCVGSTIDFGCGTGYFTKAIAENAKHVISTDVSYDMLEIVRKQLKKN